MNNFFVKEGRQNLMAAFILIVWLVFIPKLDAQVTILHSLGALPNDGATPYYCNLIQGPDGYFYGTTVTGGSAGQGAIFKMTPTGTTTILHSFSDGTVAHDGVWAYAGLVLASDGNFYGTTELGGSAGKGTIFRITPAGTVTILHSFGDGTVSNDGTLPYAPLIQASDGNFYGTTYNGGSSGSGTVFKMVPDGTVTILHNFSGSDGFEPVGGLLEGVDRTLYGTTSFGGSVRGVAFNITFTGVFTILHNFDDGTVAGDGDEPYAALIQGSDGNLYGTTSGGGTANSGTVFKMTTGGTVTILHSFGDGTIANDGIVPFGSLLEINDTLYGTTFNGGTNFHGVLFSITTSGTSMTILHNFGDGSVSNDGSISYGGLTWGFDGNLYGVTEAGGSMGDGTVFKYPGPSLTYLQWAARYFSATQLADPAISGALATPQNDRIPNLLKYLCGINPARPMSNTDKAALPLGVLVTSGGTQYLTLTYRQNPLTSGLTILSQTTTDLQSWSSVIPDITQNLSPDPATGLPVVELEFAVSGTPIKEFTRLKLSIP